MHAPRLAKGDKCANQSTYAARTIQIAAKLRDRQKQLTERVHQFMAQVKMKSRKLKTRCKVLLEATLSAWMPGEGYTSKAGGRGLARISYTSG